MGAASCRYHFPFVGTLRKETITAVEVLCMPAAAPGFTDM